MSEHGTFGRAGDSAAWRELQGRSKTRLKLQVSIGALIAIVCASHVLDGVLNGTLDGKALSLFGMTAGLLIALHHSVLLWAKRSLRA